MHRTDSLDDGRHWANPVQMPIPNSDLMSQALVLHSGATVLFYNPQQSFPSGKDTGDRIDNTHHMMVALSEDVGLTWSYARILEYHLDGLHAYPVATQDPGCNNIYVTYSVGAHETAFTPTLPFVPACEAWARERDTEEFKECVDRTMPQNYIKFTILHEGWIRRDSDWKLETEGCWYQIPDAVQHDLDTMKAAISGDVTTDNLWTAHYWHIAIILSITLMVVLMLDIVVCCVQKQLRPQVGVDPRQDGPAEGTAGGPNPTDSMLNTGGNYRLPTWRWGSNRKLSLIHI